METGGSLGEKEGTKVRSSTNGDPPKKLASLASVQTKIVKQRKEGKSPKSTEET